MKIIVNTILSGVAKLWSIMYSYRVSAKFRCYRNLLYSMWIRNFLGELGEHSVIDYPCNLLGGGAKSIKIGNNTGIQSHCVLGCWVRYGTHEFTPSITIGSNSNIGEYSQLSAVDSITIGDGVLTGRYVLINDNGHGRSGLEESDVPPIFRTLVSKGPIVIGNNVWVGDKVTILGGVTIGDNTIIAANSVVTHDVPSNCIVAGVPAKIVKQRQ